MPSYTQQIYTYLQHTWIEDYPKFQAIKPHHVSKVLQSYQTFYDNLIPNEHLRNPYNSFIHKERILYNMYMNDEIMVFKFDRRDDSDSEESSDDESDSCYSESPLESDEEPEDFINGMKIMDEYDFREQLRANEFVGGYWEPDLHWVLTKQSLRTILKNDS